MLHSALRAHLSRTAGGVARQNWHTQGSLCRNPVARPRSFRTTQPKRAGDGISVDVTYTTLWGRIATFPKRRPYATNIIVATVKTSLADIVVQLAEGKDEIDWSRNAVFVAFGFAYLGAFQWFIYVSVFSKLCPNAIRFANLPWAEKLKDKAGIRDLFKQTALDNFVHYTFIYFPIFYCFKEMIQSTDTTFSPTQIVSSALSKYWNNIVVDNLAMWSLWVPGDLLVYAVPIWMRLPLNHGISFVWTMILSYMRGGAQKKEETEKTA